MAGCADDAFSSAPYPPLGWNSAMIHVDPLPHALAYHFDATLLDIRKTMIAITAELQALQTSAALVDDANIVLCEVLTNIARHGYVARTGWIDCGLVVTSRGIECHICDGGVAYDPTQMGVTPQPPHFHAEGGYGWALIRALSEDLRYARQSDQNHLRFVIPARSC
jgi:serine/threonine-protein kinase RsbW